MFGRPTRVQGIFIYFDYHLHGSEAGGSPASAAYNGWCMRASRPDFVFEYNQVLCCSGLTAAAAEAVLFSTNLGCCSGLGA